MSRAMRTRALPLRIGIDTVEVAGVADALAAFGARYERRLFTPGEQAAAARVDGARAERYAARFAAKEAVIKALDAGEAGIAWRDIEVVGEAGRPPAVRLHGRAAALAAAAGVRAWALSISHDGARACAMVAAWCGRGPAPRAGVRAAPLHGARGARRALSCGQAFPDFRFRSDP